MDHFTVVSNRLDETREFYAAFGFVAGPRPAFRSPGLWLYLGDRPVLHIIGLDTPPPGRGVLDHMAFAVEGLAEVAAYLDARKVAYRLVRSPGADRRWQMFFSDPNGAEVEFDFASDEQPP